MADTQIDLDSLDAGLVQEVVNINPDVNPLEAPPPVDDGTHRVKLLLDTQSWEHKETKENKNGESRSYLTCRLSGQVIAEGTKNNNKRVFPRAVNTLVFDGKSVMGFILLQVWGGAKNPEARAKVAELNNYVKLAQAFKGALASEPIIRVKTGWLAQYNDGTKEEPKYKTVLSGQRNFPSDGNGGYRHVIQHKQSGQELSAHAQVLDYFPDGN